VTVFDKDVTKPADEEVKGTFLSLPFSNKVMKISGSEKWVHNTVSKVLILSQAYTSTY
jgi:hypothetical protein